VGFIYHPDAPPNVGFFRAAEATSGTLRTKVLPLPVHNRNEIENGMMALVADSHAGLIVPFSCAANIEP
jgi:hypothetical protein